MLFGQELARMPEAHLVPAHHPVDHAAAGIATKAMPEIGFRGDDAARRVVPLMPRTAAGQVLALGDEVYALALDQPLKTHLALQALQCLVRDACHTLPPIT